LDKLSIRILFFLLLCVFLPCDNAAESEDELPPAAVETTPISTGAVTANPAPGKINVEFSVAPRQENGKLYFDVETNLPDGMLFMCAIRDEMGFIHKLGATMERALAETANGKMPIGPFPIADRPFPSGEFKFYINSSPDKYQPESVIAIIGENGANLTGPDVFNGMVVFGKEFLITGSY